MPRSNSVREVLITRDVRERLSGEEICHALADHQPEKYFSFHSHRNERITVVTDDEGITRVLVLAGGPRS